MLHGTEIGRYRTKLNLDRNNLELEENWNYELLLKKAERNLISVESQVAVLSQNSFFFFLMFLNITYMSYLCSQCYMKYPDINLVKICSLG